MKLAQIEYPAEADRAAPLIVVHGLFGAAKNWRAHAKRLDPGRRVIVVDMRNHGDSPWDDVHDYPAMAGDLADVIESVGGRAAVLGHSMGGKAAMALAQTRPELVERLLVADIAPVAYDHDLMAEIDAMRALDLGAYDRRSQVEAALAETLTTPGVAAFLAQSAILGDAPSWSLNLEALAANMDAVTGYPEIDGAYDGPAFFLSGAASSYVTAAHRPVIDRLFPNATFEALDRAGHWLHVEKPRPFLTSASAFLAA